MSSHRPQLDPFTLKRLQRFVETFRPAQGQLPTLRDFEAASFTRDQVEAAIKQGAIEELYVTLTNGTIVKGFKIKD